MLSLLVLAFCSHAMATFLHREGNRLLDANGKPVRLTGVNWFGFETGNLSPHGLWARDWKGMLIQIKSLGFNSVRIPFCDKMLEPGAKANSISFFGSDPFLEAQDGATNPELKDKSPLQILDILVEGCRQLGLKVILDNHSRSPDGYMAEMVWATDSLPEEKWISNWVMLAKRYKGNTAVVAFDLDNEPHGRISAGGAQWGTGVAGKDWRLAAQKCGNAVLAENPDVLILVEGVEQVGTPSYWWGGNLTGAKTHPVVLTRPEKLVYSPHEYGPEVHAQPWFGDPAFPENMTAIWDRHFGYLHKANQAHLLVGEFGIRDAASAGGKAGIWFDEFLKYMGTGYSWTFWCMNPNSGDTGGILKSDWISVEQWKLDRLKPYMAPLIGEGGNLSAIRRLPPESRGGRGGRPEVRTDLNGRSREAGLSRVPLFGP